MFYNFLPCIKWSARASQVLFNVSRFFEFWIVPRFNLYAIAGINSTELVNEFTTEDDRWTIETCLCFKLKVIVHFLKTTNVLCNLKQRSEIHKEFISNT